MKKPDLMEMLADVRPASLTPEDDPRRLDRIIAAAARPSVVAEPVPRPGRGRPGWGWGAGVAAAGLAAAAILVPGAVGDRSAEPAARGLLLAAAEQTVNAPTGAGRYWHSRGVNSASPTDRTSDGLCRDETWVARSPKDPSWWIVHSWTRLGDVKDALLPPEKGVWSSEQAHFTCVRGRRAVDSTDGATPYLQRLDAFAEPGSSWPNVDGRVVSLAEIDALPTDPESLKEVLIQWQVPGVSDERRDEILFEQAAEMLLELPAPSGVRAALFRLMADLPDVRSLGGVRDPLGRDAVGVARRSSCDQEFGGELQVLFDKDTGRLLSVKRLDGERGCADLRPISWSAVQESGWTDESPKVPADRS
ncbi:CU044_5270 family protein [Microtetraspora malaysiensis]|uniref:CU044_5270 family protein n=1 Tax=Microtetraspora malaysiensis TaxID=161358 RepID=UPI00082CCEBD|nr:CU044_5270 family protein [Microtetraspora malaysiensis]